MFKFSCRALSPNSVSGPKSSHLLPSVPSYPQRLGGPLSAPQPVTGHSGHLAEHTAPLPRPAAPSPHAPRSLHECESLHLGYPSGVSGTLALHMRCMNCQTRTAPLPRPPPRHSVAVTALHATRHRARHLEGRERARQPVLWGKLRYGQKGPLFSL